MIAIMLFSVLGPFLGYILISLTVALVVLFAISLKEDGVKEKLEEIEKARRKKLGKAKMKVILEEKHKCEHALKVCRLLRWICVAVLLAVVVFCVVLVFIGLSTLSSVFSAR